jgi:hypothetical protein
MGVPRAAGSEARRYLSAGAEFRAPGASEGAGRPSSLSRPTSHKDNMARTQASDKKGKPKGGPKSQPQAAAAAASVDGAQPKAAGAGGEFAALVRELGGDEDDLALLAGVDSDDEGGEVMYSGTAPNEVRSLCSDAAAVSVSVVGRRSRLRAR